MPINIVYLLATIEQCGIWLRKLMQYYTFIQTACHYSRQSLIVIDKSDICRSNRFIVRKSYIDIQILTDILTSFYCYHNL